MVKLEIIPAIESRIRNRKFRSAWDRGVQGYALELLDNLREYAEYDGEEPCNEKLLRKAMLNGAESWHQYSWGGCSECYDAEIAERLCSPSELKRTNYGNWRPNRKEEWLDVQARALGQASNLITREFRNARKELNYV